MEAKAHSKDGYTKPGQASWIEQDLSYCSCDFRSSIQKRALITGFSELNQAKDKIIHVGVIGAGLAGLRCAEILIEHGINVTVIEARDRLGGRSRGPNWIHGTLDNPILNLAKRTGTVLATVEDNPCVFDQYGEVMSHDKANEISDLVWDIIKEAFQHSNENSLNISPESSLKDFFMKQVVRKGLAEEDQTLVLQMAEMWGAFIGDPLELQSLKYFWLEECLDGGEYIVIWPLAALLLGKILHAVADKVLKRAEMLLRNKVVSIENADSIEGHQKVCVKTDLGHALEFDEVVVTIPLGALKHGNTKFSPALSPEITRAIQNTSYSRLEKVYIMFPKAFWETSSSSATGKSHSSTKSTTGFKSFAHFLHPTYSPENNPESWTLELNSLSSPQIFGSYAQPTLLFGIYGGCANHITSLITPLSSDSLEYFQVIDDFFRPYYALLPNYSPDNPDCRPRAVLATNWQNDELAGYGSYMNFKTSEKPKEGTPDIGLDEDIRVLRKGMPERGIWFAGDHTAPFVALGTLTGAYWSGESVGMRISRAYGRTPGSSGGEPILSNSGDNKTSANVRNGGGRVCV
ncbi:hypothetical protein N7462_003084 [Penicillium macrosclerotiorum]|uniref:uncharacterized protein n=1 Tax=Penicillium macrosclerotiorum TaxID=303699 RepID=UPI0025498F7C|nr:uncharacterized protein N7462_003084 [Penicillium macrosclerotiorum]KAJ5688692.1 hypothetical protein N7462_003084 [Penicillium macrosclerotiorum]